MKTKSCLIIGMLAVGAALLVGCDTWSPRERHHANSLYNYLYGRETGHVDTETIPVLSLPLRVGVAFVPPDSPKDRPSYYPSEDAALSEPQKHDLVEKLSAQFRGRPFIKSVEYIPSDYLTPRGGFANLQQIRALYGIDVMVLLSYDQVQFTDQGLLSLSYWTIVGAYVFEGEKNDTQTMLDAAVYDIASRKLLFRAPGLSKIKGAATPVNLSQQLRRDSEKGFDEADTNMVAELNIQLDDFRQRIKSSPADFKIVTKPGYTGAAAFSGIEALLACGLGGLFWWTQHARRS